MSGSLTVVGGVNGGHVSGLVTVPVVLPSSQVLQNLQDFLSNTVAGAVTTGGNFQNLNVATITGGLDISNQVITPASGLIGQLAITNTNSVNVTTPGSTNVKLSVPIGYNYLVVEAPGTETITGNNSANFLAVFSSQSGVTFNSGAGSGTVVAGGPNDFINVTGTGPDAFWSVIGNALGGDTTNSTATDAFIQIYGQGNAVNNAIGAVSTPSNVVGLAGTNATVVSNGTNDLIETYAGSDYVSVTGSANVLINGGADTVYATAGSTAVRAFFNLFGGTLDFINNSTVAATVSGAVPGASGGSTTAFGGVGGGVYIGGNSGNNSLIGGSGAVNLVAHGTNNILSVSGFGGSYATQNILAAGEGGATLSAASTTGYNEFYGGISAASGGGTDSIISFGSGAQTYYIASSGSENITGSTVAGASNEYIFDQDSSGSGSDVITNFKLGKDHIDINYNGALSGVSISGFDSLGGSNSGTIIYLSDKTTIQLYGVSKSSLSTSIIGGTHI
jgi:hypothetical protein